MKAIFRFSQIFLLCLAVMFAKESAAQTFPIQFVTQQNQCLDLGIDTLGVPFTSFNILSGPFNGSLTPGIRNGSWIYCPDSNFVGTDQAFVYYCISGMPCDSTFIYFSVQNGGCNLAITISGSSPCAGPLPGITAVVTGGSPPYMYTWNNGNTAQHNCNLTQGVYCVTVTESSGCTASTCYTVGCQLPVTMATDSSGCLFNVITGGSAPFTYFWSDSSTNATVCNPTPVVSYCVTITDAQGCAGYACNSAGCSINAFTNRINPSCFTVTATGGTGAYSYSWSNGSAGATMCTGGVPGIYCVTVTDQMGCSFTTCDTVFGCNVNAVMSSSGGCIAVTPSGGNPPYTYTWSPGGNTTSTFCPGVSSTYCLTVTDANGCTFSGCRTITGGCTLPVTVTLDSSNCMIAVVSGGSAPYTYVWSDGSTTSRNCLFIPGLTYAVTVTDAQGCTGIGNFFTQCQITAVVLTDTATNCYTVTATGGTPPYAYQWSTGSTGASICNPILTIPYCVTVVDANGCATTACANQGGSCTFISSFQSTPASIIAIFTASYDQSLRPANVLWDFADGTVETGFTITRLFDSCGYASTVAMTLVDSLSVPLCSYNQSFYIPCDTFYNYCQAYFTSYQDSADNKTFHFVDQSVYNPISYSWNFGDGNLSTQANPVHTYVNPGIYNVCVVVTDSTGCSSTSCQNVNAGNVQIQDLAAYLYHHTTIRPGFPVWVNLSYCNFGTTLRDGTVEYRYPAGTTFVSSTPAPFSHNAAQRLITYNFTGLYPGGCGTIQVDLLANQSLILGSAVHDTVWVKPLAGDINQANNVASVFEFVIGSWDPNDKAVSPKGTGDDGNIPENTTKLAYKIRFQNTGTAEAINVEIRDAIDSNIDLTSVKVTGASHPHTTQIIGNELVVTFNNIMLPDSNTNEPASHGFVTFIANLKPGLVEGTQISNTAGIYFDFNDPVITNTVVNTLKDEETGIGKIAGFDFSIVPNPAQDIITISGKFSRNSVYEIMNELGQVVLSDDVSSDKMQINIKSLHAGIYLIRIKSNDKVGVQRLFVTE